MPVADHPVHPSTRVGADHRYGCWNREPFANGYFAPSRELEETLEFSMQAKFIPHVMSTDCKYDQPNDSACEGCRWKCQTTSA